jgi:hypothetical protein
MSLDTGLFVHLSDKSAMKALKAIPGFEQVIIGVRLRPRQILNPCGVRLITI